MDRCEECGIELFDGEEVFCDYCLDDHHVTYNSMLDSFMSMFRQMQNDWILGGTPNYNNEAFVDLGLMNKLVDMSNKLRSYETEML